MAEPSERTILERVSLGDAAAVREAIDAYGGLVWSLARRFSSSESDAEDAVQDIFLMLWRKASSYDPSKGAEVSFVSVLARRILIDRWRRSERRVSPERLSGEPAGDVSEPADEAIGLAMRAFEGLDDAHREVLRLSLGDGRSHAEIAEITDTPLGTIKSRIRRAISLVRSAIERGGSGENEEGGTHD
ncbi:MAG: sigma-70 family RNA polymerase sigma factor [Planctomycetota bacterium]